MPSFSADLNLFTVKCR